MARTTPLLLACLSLLLPIGWDVSAQVLCRSEADDVAALQMFHRRVDAYVEIHRRLDAPLSAAWTSSDPEVVADAVEGLADSIREERATAAEGDIFDPEVADLFHARLACVAQEEVEAVSLAALRKAGAACVSRPVVNTTLVWAGGVPVGEAFEHLLPWLPPELEYRFSGRTLVLVDADTGLVVDVLDEPFPQQPAAVSQLMPDSAAPGR